MFAASPSLTPLEPFLLLPVLLIREMHNMVWCNLQLPFSFILVACLSVPNKQHFFFVLCFSFFHFLSNKVKRIMKFLLFTFYMTDKWVHFLSFLRLLTYCSLEGMPQEYWTKLFLKLGGFVLFFYNLPVFTSKHSNGLHTGLVRDNLKLVDQNATLKLSLELLNTYWLLYSIYYDLKDFLNTF